MQEAGARRTAIAEGLARKHAHTVPTQTRKITLITASIHGAIALAAAAGVLDVVSDNGGRPLDAVQGATQLEGLLVIHTSIKIKLLYGVVARAETIVGASCGVGLLVAILENIHVSAGPVHADAITVEAAKAAAEVIVLSAIAVQYNSKHY